MTEPNREGAESQGGLLACLDLTTWFLGHAIQLWLCISDSHLGPCTGTRHLSTAWALEGCVCESASQTTWALSDSWTTRELEKSSVWHRFRFRMRKTPSHRPIPHTGHIPHTDPRCGGPWEPTFHVLSGPCQIKQIQH